MERVSLFNKWCFENKISRCETILELYITLCTTISSKCIRVKCKTSNCKTPLKKKKNPQYYSHDFLGLHQAETFLHSKGNNQQMKRESMKWE